MRLSRSHALFGLTALAVAAVLVPAGPAAAATPLTATIVCDGETGEITTWTNGRLLPVGTPPTPVAVDFQRSGRRVSAASSAPITPLPQPFTVLATTNTGGELSANGYTSTFNPATALYYGETLTVTFRNPGTGTTYRQITGACHHDQRTSVSSDCDPDAGAFDIDVSGINGNAGASDGSGKPTRIGYHVVTWIQWVQNEDRFRSETLGAWDVERRLTKAADGSWTDAGRTKTLTGDPYYYAEEVTVGTIDAAGNIVGHGLARCVLADDSAQP